MKKQVFNPYLPNYEYVPDGEPHVFNDRLYIFGSHDRFGSRFFCDNDYVTWSAPLSDLSDWKYHGIIFRKDQDPLNKKDLFPLFAPDVVQGKDGRYYLYYCPAGTKTVGVAVCDTPDGQYEFLAHVKDTENNLLGMRNYDPYPFDPAVFIDDDGNIYLYIGFSPEENYDWMEREFGAHPHSSGAFVLKLEDDMITIKQDYQKIEITDCEDKGHLFFEASSIRKINSLYYFIYSSFYSHELCYATSKSPTGPFRYRGILHDNGNIGLNGLTEENRTSYTGNNHGSLVELNGQWYIFGHRPTNYSVFARQGVAEPVEIQENGFIPQAEMTSCGLNNGPLKPEGTYGAFIACHLRSANGALHYLDNCEGAGFENIRTDHPAFSQDGEDRESNPNQYIKNMRNGSICGFKYFSYISIAHLKVTTRGAEGLFEVRTSPQGNIIAEIPLTEKQEYHESIPVKIVFPKTEKLALYFTYRGSGSIDFLSFEFC